MKIKINDKRKKEQINQMKKRIKKQVLIKIKEMALSKKENDDTIIKIVKNWSEEIPTKTPKKEQIIKYFNEIDEIKEETLNNINKYLVKHIINVLNEEYQEGQVKSIKDFKICILKQ